MDDTQGKVKSNAIYTHSGRVISLLDPVPEGVNIHDIATALSRLCRYTGHSRLFYSVAEHSCRVSDLLPDDLKLAGLLHDATEAYIGDMTSPLKRLLPEYRAIEAVFWTAIANKFNLPDPLPPQVKEADFRMFRAEWYGLMPEPMLFGGPVMLDDVSNVMTSHRAYIEFIKRFARLT